MAQGTRGSSKSGRGGSTAAKKRIPPAKQPEGQPLLAPRKGLNTRTKNRSTHPGAVAAPLPRRSSQAVQAERAQKEQHKAAADAYRSAAIARVAVLEDEMAAEDERYNHENTHLLLSQLELPQRELRKRPAATNRIGGHGTLGGDEGEYPFPGASKTYNYVCTAHGGGRLELQDEQSGGVSSEGEGEGDEYHPDGVEDDMESEDEMEGVGEEFQGVSQIIRARQPTKQGRKDVASARKPVGKRKNSSDLRER